MHIESSFDVAAPAERVYAFLLDAGRVAGCVPGAELAEVVDPDTFRGKVRVRVGPISVLYTGTAHVVTRDEAARTAVMEAEGREAGGAGAAHATVTMTVSGDGAASSVRMLTDLSVVGRAAQFGPGMMQEVSRRLIEQMGECIRSRLEEPERAPEPAAAPEAAAPLPVPVLSEEPEEPGGALGMVLAVARDRARRAALAQVGGAAGLVLLGVILLRRRRR